MQTEYGFMAKFGIGKKSKEAKTIARKAKEMRRHAKNLHDDAQEVRD